MKVEKNEKRNENISEIKKEKIDILKRFKHGMIFKTDNEYYLRISVKKRHYPEPFIYESIKIFKNELKKEHPSLRLISIDHEEFANPVQSPTIVIIVKSNENKDEKSVLNELEDAYILYWECLIDSNISNPEKYADIVVSLNLMIQRRQLLDIQPSQTPPQKDLSC